MSSNAAKIKEIEDEMARTQKNKATAGHLGRLKAKLAKLKREDLEAASKSSGGGGGEGFDVSKSGDARVGMIGFPSVGKSTLLTKITGTESESADYEFTTLTAIPGTFQYKGCNLQLLDLPGIIEGAKDGKGRGRQVIGAARTCDLILIVLDASKPMQHKKIIEDELEGFGIRLNTPPPNIEVRRQRKIGGVHVSSTVQQTKMDNAQIMQICKEFRVNCADIVLREDASPEQLIDVMCGNTVYIPALYVLNKIDAISLEELEVLDGLPNYVPISAYHEWNMDELLEEIFQKLSLIRVYPMPKGQPVDFDEPLVLPKEKRTVQHFCNRIHRSLMDNFKHALVWGSSAKHTPQTVGKDHELHDEDIIQIIKKK